MRANRETGFAPYLRLQRQRRGVELPKLAVMSRLPLARLIALESGTALPEPAELRRLAKALDIPADLKSWLRERKALSALVDADYLDTEAHFRADGCHQWERALASL